MPHGLRCVAKTVVDIESDEVNQCLCGLIAMWLHLSIEKSNRGSGGGEGDQNIIPDKAVLYI